MASQRPATEPVSLPASALNGRALARPTVAVRLSIAGAVSAAIVAGSPLVGALRQALLTHWPAGYVPALAAMVAVSSTVLLVLSVRGAMRVSASGSNRTTIRWSFLRLAAIASAVCLAVVVGYLERTGDTNVDVVEAFHFVEYSALTCLLAWAAAPVVPRQAWVWGGMGSVIVGAFDEWFQWFVPNRTGEIRDVGIDAVAAGCGVLLVLALEIGGRPVRGQLVRSLATAGAVTLLAVAICFATIHLGSVVPDAEAGSFTTRFSAPALIELGAEHARRWGRGPIPEPSLFAREDQYLSEALWHVRRRNRAMEASDVVTAWREEHILEAHYAPVLQVATPDRLAGHALAAEQLAMLEAGRTDAAGGSSDASPIPIVAWPRSTFWASVAGAVGLLVAVAVFGGPPRPES